MTTSSRLATAIDAVQMGYIKAAQPYREQKDASLIEIAVFQLWAGRLLQVNRASGTSTVVDLGCASGYPVAAYVLDMLKLDYVGIDLCPHQIELACREFPEHVECFRRAEMLEYVDSVPNGSLAGVCALFSVFHLPRATHTRLFDGILSALCPGGVLLITVSPDASEYYETDFFGAKMYYSQFSAEWYELTLTQLGFEMIAKQMHTMSSLGEPQATWYMLFSKPGDADTSIFLSDPGESVSSFDDWNAGII
ncbi:Methyltransferase domain-containing protein [Plasmodiophora brassicae]